MQKKKKDEKKSFTENAGLRSVQYRGKEDFDHYLGRIVYIVMHLKSYRFVANEAKNCCYWTKNGQQHPTVKRSIQFVSHKNTNLGAKSTTPALSRTNEQQHPGKTDKW